MNEKELLKLERYLNEFDLSEWERDTLIEFNKIKPIDELMEYVETQMKNDFLINLADGINEYRSKLIEKIVDDQKG